MVVLIVVEPQAEPQKQGPACGRQPHVFPVTIAFPLFQEFERHCAPEKNGHKTQKYQAETYRRPICARIGECKIRHQLRTAILPLTPVTEL